MNAPILRATLPDAETETAIYSIKHVSVLRATYQVRLLLFKATQQGKILVLKVPKACRFDPSLAELNRAHPDTIKREDLT